MDAFKQRFGSLQPDGTVDLSSSTSSVIVSMLSLGTFFGALAGAPISDIVGRKYGLVVTPKKAVSISANIDGGQPWRRTVGDYNVVYNFFRSLKPLIDQFEPTRVYFTLEGHPKRRYDLLPTYKANRHLVVPATGIVATPEEIEAYEKKRKSEEMV